MVVRAGREFLAIPGPTTIPDEVLAAMHRPAVDIYSGSLVATTDGLLADLKRIFRTQGHAYIYIANGHGTWEAALTTVLSPGDRVLVLVSGRFAAGWGATAEGIGIGIETIDFGWHEAVSPAAVEERLRRDTGRQIKAVLVHVEQPQPRVDPGAQCSPSPILEFGALSGARRGRCALEVSPV